MSRMLRVVALAVLLSLSTAAALAQEPEQLRSELAENRERQETRARELAEVREQAGDARARLRAAEGRLEDARATLARRREDLRAARAELTDARERAQRARGELRAVGERLAATEARLLEKQGRLDDRVRAAFKYGQVSFTEAFVGVRDLNDFLNSSTYVGHVMAADKELVEDVAALLGRVEAQRVRAQRARAASEREARRAERVAAEIAVAERDQRRLTEQVAARRAAHRDALEDLQQDAAAISEHLDALQRSEDEVRARIAEAERLARQRLEEERRRREEAARERAGDGSGDDAAPPPPAADGWLRPTDGRLTSGYGSRPHPVLGGTRLHAGVDLASPPGTPVRASRAGVVAFVGWMSGYGQTVLVSHGEGQVSLYAHLSQAGVAEGASVASGDALGGVGMSGTATGPHLHFEVRSGGQPRDPCGYIRC